MVILFLVFKGIAILFCILPARVCITANSGERSLFLYTLPIDSIQSTPYTVQSMEFSRA